MNRCRKWEEYFNKELSKIEKNRNEVCIYYLKHNEMSLSSRQSYIKDYADKLESSDNKTRLFFSLSNMEFYNLDWCISKLKEVSVIIDSTKVELCEIC